MPTTDKFFIIQNKGKDPIYVNTEEDGGTLQVMVRTAPEEGFEEVKPNEALQYPLDGEIKSCVHNSSLRYSVRSLEPFATTFSRSPRHRGLILGLAYAPN